MERKPMISCIVPVYNNENTIEHVLDVLCSCRDIDELIVVDDFSTDGSAGLLLRHPGAKVILNKSNLGKGGAVVKGIHAARGDTLLLCDADLSTLEAHHIARLIAEYQAGDYGMVIAGRESNIGWAYLMSLISGERIFQRKAIEHFLPLIAAQGNGIEQIINFAFQGKKVKVIINKGVGHIDKWQRGNILKWMPAYAKEAQQLLATEMLLGKVFHLPGFYAWLRRIGRAALARIS